ncbi:hypothetical protein E4U57_007522 [Claviceps arundinis]|uniref:Uncharacterized protein n=1 Tax=Claviceps arundinis TaxID=1623583 RepID=A0ABQ7P0Z1_9HYPO|nr:hypothetical protein E4U57_007522 [Claviceps arundinis]
MSSSKKLAAVACDVVGKVSKDAVVEASGATWGRAVDKGTQIAQETFPRINAVKIHGAKAHQSHTVPSHSSVISVAFYDGKKHIVSGHIHENGTVDFSKLKAGKAGKASKAGGSSSGSASTQPQFETGLKWQMDPDNPHQAIWWNCTRWENGQWSDEHHLWIAYCNDTWYAWTQ